MYLCLISNLQLSSRGYTLLPLQGVGLLVIPDYPGCRFACPGLRARWDFSPLCLMSLGYVLFAPQGISPR